MWKGGFTSRVVGNHKNRYELRFEDDGTVTATEKNTFLQQSGQGTWTREGAFVMNYPEEVFTGTVATGGQVAHRRSLPKERRERRRPAVGGVRAARGPWKSRPHLLLHYSLIYTHK